MGVDRLTKSAHSIPVKSTYLAEHYAKILIDYIVFHHGISLSIIFDRGAQFLSRFRRSFQQGFGYQGEAKHHFLSLNRLSSGV